MSDDPSIVWTRSEALAAAYCWCEFAKPETRPDSPERYWLSINEKSRMECRKIVKDRHLLAVAMRQASPVFHPANATPAQLEKVAEFAGLKQPARVWQIVQAVRNAFMPPQWSTGDSATITADFRPLPNTQGVEP